VEYFAPLEDGCMRMIQLKGDATDTRYERQMEFLFLSYGKRNTIPSTSRDFRCNCPNRIDLHGAYFDKGQGHEFDQDVASTSTLITHDSTRSRTSSTVNSP